MKNYHLFQNVPILLLLIVCYPSNSQTLSNVYHSEQEEDGAIIHHELKLDGDYLTHTLYQKKPAKFIKTVGGFFKIEGQTLKVELEFNSNYEKDSIAQLNYDYKINQGSLTLYLEDELTFNTAEELGQELDGQWLFGTRGPDKGQERRGDSRPRKTLKYLQNGRFQWIAYNIETMKFSGTGGGSYTSKDGVYQENIEFFSRDNSRVGAALKFDYTLKGNDWHHQGKNSKGEPMYEIWMRRE